MLLVCPTLSYGKELKTSLDKIKYELQIQTFEKEQRFFAPEIIFLENDENWIAKINKDYLVGVVAAFDYIDNVPIDGYKISIFETREFGIVIGVSVTALLFFLIK